MPTRAPTRPFRPIASDVRPIDVLRAWPIDRPLACLISPGGSPRARWSIFAAPERYLRVDAAETAPPLQVLDDAIDARAAAGKVEDGSEPALPFIGGWIGWLSYRLGSCIEPAASSRTSHRSVDDRGWRLMEFARCPGVYLYDADRGEWYVAGDESYLPPLPLHAGRRASGTRGFQVGKWASRTGRPAYEGAVARTIEYIHAGDIFQANLAHRLSASFDGSPRAFAAELLEAAEPRYGAYIEHFDASGGLHRAVISASPELFLALDRLTRRVETRPIKGTRAAGGDAAQELEQSPKDAAELAMIVDLMRNDLGRVCEYGSIRVDEPRSIERHGGRAGGVLHGVASITGTLREGVSIGELLHATFPPGSVTGAPKIRAMQIIDALEPVSRGPYCGAIGYISDAGDSMFSVAIRTALLACEAGSTAERARGTLDYSVGAGIVADSDPAKEWEETMHKSAALRALGSAS